jgi:mRNA interferase MazF
LADAPGNVLLRREESKLKDDSVVIVAQFYAIDRSRLKDKISKINTRIMEKVELGMKLVLGIK